MISFQTRLPFFDFGISAGFPSPATDLIQESLNLETFLIKNPVATYFIRVIGDSMIEAGIQPDSLLVVDRSVRPQSGDIVVASIDGEFTVKRYTKTKTGIIFLRPENKLYKPIVVPKDADFILWGVVTSVITKFK